MVYPVSVTIDYRTAIIYMTLKVSALELKYLLISILRGFSQTSHAFFAGADTG